MTSDALAARELAASMRRDVASNAKLLLSLASVSLSRDQVFNLPIAPKSMIAQELLGINQQRAALNSAYCELTAIQGCSEINRAQGRPVTRPYAQCGHSVGLTGGFCGLNAMNGYINPSMAARLLDMFGDDSVVDLGAGQGQYGIFAEALRPTKSGSSRWRSIDSTHNIHTLTKGLVHFADLTAPADIQGIEPADWALCIEAAEHVPKASQAALIANLHFLNRKGVILSWALPDQPGSHHINCQTNEYVEHLFKFLGYARDRTQEMVLRDAIAATLERSAITASHTGRAFRYDFWGKVNNTALQYEIDKVAHLIPRHARHLVTYSACPWLYDSLMVFRREQPLHQQTSSAHGLSNRSQIRSVLEAERRRLDAMATKVVKLRDELGRPRMSPFYMNQGKEVSQDLKEHMQKAAARVPIPQPQVFDGQTGS